jgi:hypothetical protein
MSRTPGGGHVDFGPIPKVQPSADAPDATARIPNMHNGLPDDPRHHWQAVGFNGDSGNGDEAIGPKWDPNKLTYYYGNDEMDAIDAAHGYGEGFDRPEMDMDGATQVTTGGYYDPQGKPAPVQHTIEGGPGPDSHRSDHGTIIYTP